MQRRSFLIASLAAASCLAVTSHRSMAAEIAGPEGRLFVDDGGSGTAAPAVFIHSFAGSSKHWAAQLAHLRPMRRAVAIDVRGHGRSEKPKSLDAFAVARMAEDIEAVMTELELPRAILVGSSMGGPIALAYAAQNPTKVAGIVLVGPPGKTPADQAEKIIASLEADYAKVATGYLEGLLKGATAATRSLITEEFNAFPQDAGLAIIKALFAFDPLPALDLYRGPVLAVITQQNGQPTDLHKLRPDLPLNLIEGTSHWPHLDKPDVFNRILDEFLAPIG